MTLPLVTVGLKFPKLGFLHPQTENGGEGASGSVGLDTSGHEDGGGETESKTSGLKLPKLGFLHPGGGGSGSGSLGFGISASGGGSGSTDDNESTIESGSSLNLFAGFFAGGNGFFNH